MIARADALAGVSCSIGCSSSHWIGKRLRVKPFAANHAISDLRGTVRFTLGKVPEP